MKKEYVAPEVLTVKLSKTHLLAGSTIQQGEEYKETDPVLSKQEWGSLWEEE